MPVHVNADRVQETTTTTGTGPVSLAGATAQSQTFIAAVGSGNECDYLLLSGDNTNWESGITIVHSGTPPTITRDTIITSTNSGSAISLSGTSQVYLAPTAGRLYGRFGRQPTRPALSTFTWNNQGTAAATNYINGPLTMTVPPVSGDQLRGLTQTLSAAPWTATVEIEALPFIGSAFGLILLDSTGKAITLEAQFTATPVWAVYHWASVTSLTATKYSATLYPTTRYWFRIYNDGTNLNYFMSINGVDWVTLGSEAVGSFLGTLSSVGILGENNTAVAGVPNNQISVWAFELVSGTGSNVQWI